MKVIGTLIILLFCIINVYGLYLNSDRSKSSDLSRTEREANENENEVVIHLYLGTEPKHHKRRHHHNQDHRRRCQRNRITATGRLTQCRRMHIFNRIN